MLTKRLISRLALSAVLLAGGAILPAVAHAHGDNDDRGRWSHGDNHRHHYRHDHDHHRGHGRHWDRHDRHGRHDARDVRVIERYHVAPPVHYAPVPVYQRPGAGVTVIYRNQW